MFGWGSKPKQAEETTTDIDFGGASESFQAPETDFVEIPGSNTSASGDVGVDRDLQRAIALEQQRAQFQAQVHKLTEICWDTCVEKTGSYYDSRTESCISNCVNRYIDVTLTITTRFAQMLQGQRGGF